MINQKLPSELLNKNFNEMFSLKPDERSKVLVFNKESKKHEDKTIFRSYESFLSTPKFDESVEKSYIYVR